MRVFINVRSFNHWAEIVIIVCLLLTGISGCMVGPDFQSPDAPAVKSYTSEPLPNSTAESSGPAGASQRFIAGGDIPGLWWQLFHSEELNALIQQAFNDNPSLALAKARLRQAQENRNARFGYLLPAADVAAGVSRQKISGDATGQGDIDIPAFNLINASVTVSYTLDVFGGFRRQLEAAQAQIDYERFQLKGAYQILSANIVTTAVQEASLRLQIQTTHELVALEEEQLDIIRKRFNLGGVSQSDILTQRALLAQTRSTLPPLEKDLSLTRHQLAILTGKLPGEVTLAQINLDTMRLPEELPVSLPSQLVRQRPDVGAADALLHAACAQVGVATANLYPAITLSASYGTASSTVSDLFSGSTTVWNLSAGLLQPVFHGGTLTAERRAAIAFYDQAMAAYRDTILNAFSNVADVLRSLEADARALQTQAEATQAARESLDLTRKQFEAGAVSYLNLLVAQQQYGEARILLTRARAARFADTAALYPALGGGWWNEDQTPKRKNEKEN
ncbi:MAG TPA: efflux transporter outer membrane subunit [Smithella sp.]|nr:efflux transporter outer membrane subunit [Smithella sp.]